MKIFKYALKNNNDQIIKMPIGATILTVQVQRNIPMLWAVVDEKVEMTEDRKIIVEVTGFPLSNYKRYIGTYQLENGSFVGHVFEA